MTARFPFSDVVGQDDAKLALTLAAVDPLIGGVLLRGHKGSAKTTLARGLAAMLGRFTELPLGTTEDRLIGTLDVTSALAGGEPTFRPGLLAAADGGVLYVDEVNLLADHLVDVLLDVAVSGENIVERDGVSHRHPARFVLVGSMNPEEGELRPQLLDRFGLCVHVTAPASMDDRVEAVRRRLSFDRDPEAASGEGADRELAERIGAARPAQVGDDVMTAASRLALAAGAEGLRADLILCRAAAALAGLEGREVTDVDDLRRVAHLVLAHRARRGPFDSPTIPPDQMADTVDDALGDPPDDRATSARRRIGARRAADRRWARPADRPCPRPPSGRPTADGCVRADRRRTVPMHQSPPCRPSGRWRPRRRRPTRPCSSPEDLRTDERSERRAAPHRSVRRPQRLDGSAAARRRGHGRRARLARRRLPAAPPRGHGRLRRRRRRGSCSRPRPASRSPATACAT